MKMKNINDLISACKPGDAVNCWRALLVNEFYFQYHASARATQPTMYDQVNFYIYIDLYIRLCSDLKKCRLL